MDLLKLTKKEMEVLSPKNIPKVSKSHLAHITEIDTFIKHNEEIHKNHQKFDLKWAFKNTQNRMNEILDEILEKEIASKIYALQEKEQLCDELEELRAATHKRKISFAWNRRTFTVGSFLVSFIDIIISIFLIVLISQIAHKSEPLFTSVEMATLFIAFVAFLKVTLDRFFIIPKVHNWGWMLYKKLNNSFKEDVAIVLATSIVLENLSETLSVEELEQLLEVAHDEILHEGH